MHMKTHAAPIACKRICMQKVACWNNSSTTGWAYNQKARTRLHAHVASPPMTTLWPPSDYSSGTSMPAPQKLHPSLLKPCRAGEAWHMLEGHEGTTAALLSKAYEHKAAALTERPIQPGQTPAPMPAGGGGRTATPRARQVGPHLPPMTELRPPSWPRCTLITDALSSCTPVHQSAWRSCRPSPTLGKPAC